MGNTCVVLSRNVKGTNLFTPLLDHMYSTVLDDYVYY